MLVVFWGERKTPVSERTGKWMTAPLIILAIASVAAGWMEWPHNLIHFTLFSDQLQQVLPAVVLKQSQPSEFIFQGIAALVTIGGLYTGYVLYYRNKTILEGWQQSAGIQAVRNFLLNGWEFDSLYNALLVRPFIFVTRINKKDVFDRLYNGIAQINININRLLSLTQNGSLRWYIAGVLLGILFIITMQLL